MSDKAIQAQFLEEKIPTYLTGEPMKLPFFFEKKPYQGACGKLYPLQFNDTLTGEKIDKVYQVGILENQYIRIEVMPEIGGKISRGYDKIGKYDFMYHNSVVKPALIGLAGPWVSGGIEFNWPQHHRPTTFQPLAATLENNSDDSATIWMGEVDPLLRMKGMAGITLEPGRSYCKVKVRLYNRTDIRQPMMWWANLAVPVNNDYQIIFPPDVEYVNDHDRRAVVGWPIAKGIYNTARPFDYGVGTDLSWYGSIKVPSSFMVSEGQSDMDFVCGYDHGKQKGIVSWADHRIAPGKKLFHWGVEEFGKMWGSNLTDEDGPYVELMTGVYTDNQPDFCWIQPGETKEFVQYWYPVREIGPVKNATIDAALNMEQQDDGLFIGVHATGDFPGATVSLQWDGREVWTKRVDLSCEVPMKETISWNPNWNFSDLYVAVRDAHGDILVDFKMPKRGEKSPIIPRKPVPRPSEIQTVEELYVHGLHLEQYKQHNYDPKDYYLAGLIKDPQDIRCNTAMARLAYKAGEFTKCVEYCSVAMERLLSRNEHPEYLEPIYLKALALVRLHDDESAARLFDKVLWSYTLRSQAFFELACIDARRGAFTSALTNLKACLETNPNHSRAANLLAAITRKSAGPLPDDVLQIHISSDPLDIMARLEYWFANKSDSRASELMQIFGKNPQWYLDAIGEYMYAGLYDDALSVLDFIDSASPIVPFYRAFLSSKIALKCSDDGLPLGDGVYFPNRADDFSILTWAVDHRFHADEAAYLAGCYLYDKERYDEAISYWESAIALNPRHAYAFRTLAIGYFDKKHDKRSARLCMEKAFKLTSDSRIFYELQQLLKQSNVSSEYRLSLYEQDRFLTEKRDDCYLDWITLLCSLGKYEDAMHLIGNRTFHIYEGGEGKLTKQHGWLYVLSGLSHLGRGEYEPAIELFRQASIIPPSYGEAKSWFAQEGHIYYFIGEALRLSGEDKAKSHEAYRTASEPKSAISEISLFRALALQRLEAFSEARNVLEEMIEQGDALLANADRYPYFGVGSVTPTPFNYDIRKTNEIEGGILKAFALLGLGRIQEADKVLASVKALDPYEFRLHVFDTIAPFV